MKKKRTNSADGGTVAVIFIAGSHVRAQVRARASRKPEIDGQSEMGNFDDFFFGCARFSLGRAVFYFILLFAPARLSFVTCTY